MLNKKSALILLPILLASCSHSSLQQDFGEAVMNNQQEQIVNPEPVNPDRSLGFDGQKAETVMENYRQEEGSAVAEKLVTDMVND